MRKIHAVQQQGYELFQEGLIALAQVEANGIRVDVERLERTKERLAAKIRSLRLAMEEDKVWRVWRKR